jgi:F-type H+-transporting ATPase subunit b
VLPDLSVFLIIALILALAAILDRLGFRPVLAVGERRVQAVSSARALAERAADEARQATAEFDRKTQEARPGPHRQMEEIRRTALEDRAALVGETRQEAARALGEARAALSAEVVRARARLDADAESLAAEAPARILGRRPSCDQSTLS